MKLRQKVFAAMGLLILFACSGEPRKIQDVAYYLENTEARTAMTEKCNSNPGLFNSEPNCVNAEEARRLANIDATMAEAHKTSTATPK